MKIYIFLISFVFIGCQNFNDVVNESNFIDEYNEKVNKELNKDTLINDIFLNLKFGDSEKLVNSKIKKLYSQKKLQLNSNNKYVYEFIGEIELENGISTIIPSYHNNKLYKLTLFVTPKKQIYSTNDLVYFELLYLTLNKKYRAT